MATAILVEKMSAESKPHSKHLFSLSTFKLSLMLSQNARSYLQVFDATVERVPQLANTIDH